MLSSVSPLFPDVSSAVNTQPSILYDPTGVLCFAFLTNGTVIGTVHSATSVRDVVVAGITLQGALLWVNQGSMYIAAPFLYDNCDAPFLSADDYGNVFLSLLTVSPTVQNILLFRIHPSDGCSTWQYITPGTNTIYGVYGYALTGAPYAVFSSQPLGSFTRLAVSMRSNALYVGTTVRPSITAPGNTYVGSGRNVCVTQMSQRNYFENLSPFQYETNAIVPTPICTPTVSPAVSPAFTPASYNTILRRTKFRPGL